MRALTVEEVRLLIAALRNEAVMMRSTAAALLDARPALSLLVPRDDRYARHDELICRSQVADRLAYDLDRNKENPVALAWRMP